MIKHQKWGFPTGSVVKNPPVMQEMQVQFLGWEDPLEKEMAAHFSILAGKSTDKRSLVGYSPWGPKRFSLETKQQQENARNSQRPGNHYYNVW